METGNTPPDSSYLLLSKVHDALQPVGLGADRARHHHVRQTVLRLRLRQSQQLGHPGEPDLGVVLGHHPDVVLHNARLQVGPPLLPGLSGAEGLGLAQLGLELLAELSQGDDLVSDEPLQHCRVSRDLLQGSLRLDSGRNISLHLWCSVPLKSHL